MHKSLILLIVLICATFCGFAQSGIITGMVVDAETSAPVELVNIYVNRTTIGTTTSFDGTFRLTVPIGNQEVVWSRVGYKTQKIVVTVTADSNPPLTVKLLAEQMSLSEITISAKEDKAWEKSFNQFRKVFFGTDAIADKCVISNMTVLDFQPAKEGNGFTATASEPLEIINPLLGYKIKYELLGFTYSRRTYSIAGNIQFENLAAENSAVLELWNKNRLTAYRNSVRSFLKSVIDNRIEEDGYRAFVEKRVEKEFGRPYLFAYFKPYMDPFERSKHLRDTTNGNFIFYSRTRIEIHDARSKQGTAYRDVRFPVSWVELSQPLYISKTGVVYNQRAIQLIGHLTNFRVAHLLPEDYEPNIILKPKAPQLPSDLTEQIYLHTDKDYYYPGDPVWFKGYMRYGKPELADSMSRVAYVEVIDNAKRVVNRKIIPIEYGTFDGKTMIPSSIGKGNVTLRAYTEWMRNFDNNLFLKSLPILDPYEKAVETTLDEIPSLIKVIAKSSKDEYRFGDDIEVNIHAVDANGDTIAADLSVSVTDYDLIKPITKQAGVASAFSMLPKFIGNDHNIEKGITVAGTFTDKEKKFSEPVLVTAVLGQLEDMTSVKTTADGNFFISGFHFYDSATIGLQALNKKKRPYGEFTVIPHSSPEVARLPEPVTPTVIRTYTAMPKAISSDDDGGVLLKEVTVTAKREKPYKSLYSKGDVSVSRDRILELNPVDIMSLFRGRIPRLRVSWMVDNMGILQEIVYIAGMGAPSEAGMPLFVIDGMQVEGAQAIRIIKSMNVREVESIDVFASASAAIYGSRGAQGVVVINTRTMNGQFKSSDPSKFSTYDFSTFNITGFSSFKPFVQNPTETFSSTVYWNPYVLVDANQSAKIAFKATTHSKRYLISIEGFTRDGKAVSGNSIINLND